MSTKQTTYQRVARRVSAWLRESAPERTAPEVFVPTRQVPPVPPGSGPGHAPGHRHSGPPPQVPTPHTGSARPRHDQPWVPTGGLIDRLRRSERRG